MSNKQPSTSKGQNNMEEHKAIHQQEMVDAILDNRNITSQVTFLDAVQYYTETFNK
jgi:hypothetical protein